MNGALASSIDLIFEISRMYVPGTSSATLRGDPGARPFEAFSARPLGEKRSVSHVYDLRILLKMILVYVGSMVSHRLPKGKRFLFFTVSHFSSLLLDSRRSGCLRTSDLDHHPVLDHRASR